VLYFYLHPFSFLFPFVCSKVSKHFWLFSYMTHGFLFFFQFHKKMNDNYKPTKLTWKQIIEHMLAHNFSLWFTQKSKHSKLTQKWKQKVHRKAKTCELGHVCFCNEHNNSTWNFFDPKFGCKIDFCVQLECNVKNSSHLLHFGPCIFGTQDLNAMFKKLCKKLLHVMNFFQDVSFIWK
jgi:hypothetical protein